MPTKTARKRKQSKPKTYTLTQRDLDLLASIHDFGGVLTTVQISTLHWPPDVMRRLASWQVPASTITEWTANYEPGYLAAKVEQLKWGQRVNRVRGKDKRSKADQKLVEWIAGLEPLVQEELRVWLDQLAVSGTGGLAGHCRDRQTSRRPMPSRCATACPVMKSPVPASSAYVTWPTTASSNCTSRPPG